MNLVAKEFVAAQGEKSPGVLVLSRFTGAADAMRDAVIVNPYDIEGTAEATYRALRMPRRRTPPPQPQPDGSRKARLVAELERFLLRRPAKNDHPLTCASPSFPFVVSLSNHPSERPSLRHSERSEGIKNHCSPAMQIFSILHSTVARDILQPNSQPMFHGRLLKAICPAD